ncbi:MAG TPA: ribosome biogenesis GTPase Der [Candidatus Absconditabacterales bacterium]|nr:ribosome biogenesis GTPase Der [Candidatus Absconditabacterales bacterium]
MKLGLIGATNVGKSTLFNRLIGTHRSIVTDIAGTTRDIVTEIIDMGHSMVSVSDSPGLDHFDEEMIYIRKLIADSDYLLFVIDYTIGLTAKEYDIIHEIRKAGREDQTLLVINKADKWMTQDQKEIIMSEYWALGLASIIMISAKNGAHLDELEDMIAGIAASGSYKKVYPKHELIVSFVGKPNVGKSTLINTFAKSSISKVSDVPGTTLDYVTQEISYGDTIFKLVDTAGIRKQSKIHGLEKIALEKTLKMLAYYKPIVVLMRDALEGVSKQDLHLVGELISMGLPIIIARNKIDECSASELKRLQDGMPELMRFAHWIPVCYISGQEGKHLDNLIKTIKKVHTNRSTKVSTNMLNTIVLNAQATSPAKFSKNKICKIRYITQIEGHQPSFICFLNNHEKMNFAMARWLDNVLRKNIDFTGVPLNIDFR